MSKIEVPNQCQIIIAKKLTFEFTKEVPQALNAVTPIVASGAKISGKK